MFKLSHWAASILIQWNLTYLPWLVIWLELLNYVPGKWMDICLSPKSLFLLKIFRGCSKLLISVYMCINFSRNSMKRLGGLSLSHVALTQPISKLVCFWTKLPPHLSVDVICVNIPKAILEKRKYAPKIHSYGMELPQLLSNCAPSLISVWVGGEGGEVAAIVSPDSQFRREMAVEGSGCLAALPLSEEAPIRLRLCSVPWTKDWQLASQIQGGGRNQVWQTSTGVDFILRSRFGEVCCCCS